MQDLSTTWCPCGSSKENLQQGSTLASCYLVWLAAMLVAILGGCAGGVEPSSEEDEALRAAPMQALPLVPTGPEVVTSTPELEAVVRSAVARWAAATGREWVYEGRAAEASQAAYHVQPGEPPEGFIAFTFGDGSIVVSPSWLDSPELPLIVLHELGHAFGGDHHEGGGVMHYGLGDGIMTDCLSAADLRWACEKYECTQFNIECQTIADKARQSKTKPDHEPEPEPEPTWEEPQCTSAVHC